MARYFHQLLSKDNINQSILLRRLLQEGIRLLGIPKSDADLTDMVRDFAAALTGKEIDFTSETTPQCPNGIKIGETNLVKESQIYDGLPPIMTIDQYENGDWVDGGSYYPA